MGQAGAGLQWFARGTSYCIPVLPSDHGSRGTIVIKGKTVTCNEGAWSSGACGEGSDGRIVSRRVLGGEKLQLM